MKLHGSRGHKSAGPLCYQTVFDLRDPPSPLEFHVNARSTFLLVFLLAAGVTAAPISGGKKASRPAAGDSADLELPLPKLEEVEAVATRPATSPPAAAVVPVATTPPPAAVVAAPARHSLELALRLGGGRIGTSSDQDASAFGRLELGAVFEPIERLSLGLGFAEQAHDRSYLTTMPDESGSGARRVAQHERVTEARLTAAYDLGELLFGSDRGGLAPSLELRPGRFTNDLAPQNVFGVGGGLTGWIKVGEKLRLGADVSYAYNVLAKVKGPALDALDALLAAGHQLGALRWGAEGSYEIAAGTRVSLAYRSEWLAEQRASRTSDGLMFGLLVTP